MFEQSLYAQEQVAAPLQDDDLFHNFEIKSWILSSRIYKIIGLSAVANLLAVVIVAQASLLTMKGCDSPLVSSVCQVLDTVYVGSKLLGTDREYIDAEYEVADPLTRVSLVQERMNLESESATLEAGQSLVELEEAFVATAKSYSERKGITYSAWREVGVPPSVLKAAGVSRSGY